MGGGAGEGVVLLFLSLAMWINRDGNGTGLAKTEFDPLKALTDPNPKQRWFILQKPTPPKVIGIIGYRL